MNLLARLFRHLITTQLTAQRMFPIETQQRLQQAIAYGEVHHRAELRLIIEAAMPLRKVLRKMTPRERALELFSQYGIWDTPEDNGVLLYINVSDRCAELIADRAASKAITDSEWQKICNTMLAWFKREAYEQGVIDAINAIHSELRQAFPDDGTPEENAQPDEPVMI